MLMPICSVEGSGWTPLHGAIMEKDKASVNNNFHLIYNDNFMLYVGDKYILIQG